MDKRQARIAVVGAGAVGRQHIDRVASEARLSGVVDPDTSAQEIARRHSVDWFPSIAALLSVSRPDGVIVATPNRLHVENSLECIAAGIPVLVEKPISDDVAAATMLANAAESAGVPILVGHHRRHNPLIRHAKAEIQSGRLGRIVAVQATCWFYKPDAYFDIAWRRLPGAGPLFINLIHDIDLMRYLCGEVVAVQAQESKDVRGYPVEDTAAVVLRFANGALGTMSVSDAVVAPWSWELTAAENPTYPQTGESCYRIAGTKGAISIPDLRMWSYDGAPSWTERLVRHDIPYETEDPLTLQVRHFSEVALGIAEPLVSARDGLAALRMVAAIKLAAHTGRLIELDGL